jgi:hypothetical protein
MNDAADVLFKMRRRGMKIWAENGELRYQGPIGILTQEDISMLRGLKPLIVAYFQQTLPRKATEPLLIPRDSQSPVPLTFCQQWFWNVYDLERRPSFRFVSQTVRLSGDLQIETLRRSLAEIIRRHESLRTRLVTVDHVPMQVIDEPDEFHLEIADLAGLSRIEQSTEAKRLVETLVNEPLSVAAGPVFKASLMRLSDDEHLLAIAMDHIISDGTSMVVLWRDLFSIYAQFARGLTWSLPNMSLQYADYAAWQQCVARPWAERHDSYWREHLVGARGLQLFESAVGGRADCVSWSALPIRLGTRLSMALRELSRTERTSLAMTVFTAYVATILRWCNESDIVVLFLTTGRLHPDVENTIGFFGHPLFLRIALLRNDTFVDLLRRVSTEYGTAYEHDDSARLLAQVPIPEIAFNPAFSWNPTEFNASPSAYIGTPALEALGIEQVEFDLTFNGQLIWDGEVRVDLSETPGGVAGAIGYRADRVPSLAIERFERNFRGFLEALVTDPKGGMAALSCRP